MFIQQWKLFDAFILSRLPVPNEPSCVRNMLALPFFPLYFLLDVHCALEWEGSLSSCLTWVIHGTNINHSKTEYSGKSVKYMFQPKMSRGNDLFAYLSVGLDYSIKFWNRLDILAIMLPELIMFFFKISVLGTFW